jgi:glycosyltransferase involved in cell wall biosynthesis
MVQIKQAMRILCVHQGYELYGSDRCFIDCVAALRDAWPGAEIEVVVPRDGPIVPPLSKIASRVVVEPVLVLRRRHIMKLISVGLFRLLPALWRAISRAREADLVYVSTVVVLDYLLAARLFSRKTIVHIHEIPDGFALKCFRRLLDWSRAEVIFNSKATRGAFDLSEKRPQHVVYNGIENPRASHPFDYDGSRPLRLLMIGRINRIKGQDLLIDALASLPRPMVRRLQVRIVGGSFESDVAREAALHRRVSITGLEEVVRFERFHDDPGQFYQWADVVVVPSRLPESLGRVAIEAMAHGRPALVAAQGGLLEVVEDGVTGWVVPPNDPRALAAKLAQIATQAHAWRSFPAAARMRYEAMFDGRVIAAQFQAIARARLAGRDDDRRISELARV